MAYDFETSAMVITILILGANAMVGYTSEYFYDASGAPLNYTEFPENYDFNAEYRYDQSRELEPNFDEDLGLYSTLIETPLSYLSNSLAAFGQVGKLVFNLGFGTQQAIFIAVSGFRGMGSVYQGLLAFAWIIVGIISTVEAIGIFYLFVRFVSLIRGGGGVG